jgi:hypothetical protein
MDCTESTASKSSFFVMFVYLLLWSRELVAMEMYLQNRSLATAISSGSAIPAFSKHVTILNIEQTWQLCGLGLNCSCNYN